MNMTRAVDTRIHAVSPLSICAMPPSHRVPSLARTYRAGRPSHQLVSVTGALTLDRRVRAGYAALPADADHGVLEHAEGVDLDPHEIVGFEREARVRDDASAGEQERAVRERHRAAQVLGELLERALHLGRRGASLEGGPAVAL